MAQAVAKKGDPQEALEEDRPTGRRAGGIMVHFQRTGLMVGAGQDKDVEAPHTEGHSPIATVEPKARTVTSLEIGLVLYINDIIGLNL